MDRFRFLFATLVVAVLGACAATKVVHYKPAKDTGIPCNRALTSCQDFCRPIDVDGQVDACTSRCTDSSDCLPGWTCEAESKTLSVCRCIRSPEVCDGKDDDCDGLIDDFPDADLACRAKSSGLTCDNGACACPGALQCGACIDTSRDPKNCGTCGNVCPAGAWGEPFCAAGNCTTIEAIPTPITNTSRPDFIFAVDRTNVYTGNEQMRGSGSGYPLVEIPLDGRPTTTLTTNSRNIVLSMAVDATYVFWAAMGFGLYRVPIAGGDVLKIASGNPSYGLAVDADNVYWTALSPQEGLLPAGILPVQPGGEVDEVPKNGWPKKVLADNQSDPWGIAVDANWVYWTDFGAGTVMKVPKAGGAPIVLASNQAGPTAITVDATNVYWTNIGTVELIRSGTDERLHAVPSTGSVMKMPKVRGLPVALAANEDRPCWGIAVYGTSVYWLDSALPFDPNSTGSVRRVLIAGGTPMTLVDWLYHPWDMALVGSDLFWSVSAFVSWSSPPYRFYPDSAIERLSLR